MGDLIPFVQKRLILRKIFPKVKQSLIACDKYKSPVDILKRGATIETSRTQFLPSQNE